MENNKDEVLNSKDIASSPDVFPLDEETASLLGEYAMRAMALDAERRGALTLFARRHRLQGNWQLAENGKDLVRSPGPAPAPAVDKSSAPKQPNSVSLLT
jgi:hypothetical protein